jgi:hypothetical protein
MLDRNRLTVGGQVANPHIDGVLRHRKRFIDRFALRDTTRERGHLDDVPPASVSGIKTTV